jgi:hypothetical protein
MKKYLSFAAAALLVLMSTAALAASSITATVYSVSQDKNVLVIKLACIAHTDGDFTDTYPTGKEITHAELFPSGSELGELYYHMGYYLYEVWAVNPATGYPTVAAAVTITDATGAALLASGELALSTSASGITEASLGKFRSVTSQMTATVGDTGTAANTPAIYIKLVR